MKAAVFYEQEDLRLEDVAEPEAGPDEVVVRVLACGFCGSDVEYYYGKSPLGTPDGKGPLVLGHELCGEVVQVGALGETYGVAEGDRVSVNPVQSCNACNACRAGKVAFCQNLTVLGVTTNGGVPQYAEIKIADAYWVPDLAQAIQEVNDGHLADRVLVATANVEANQQAIEISGLGSVVVLMGLAGPNDAISVPLLSNLAQDKTIRFSWLYPLQWPTTIQILEAAKIDTGPIITHSASLAEIGPAIERVLLREDDVVKTVIKP